MINRLTDFSSGFGNAYFVTHLIAIVASYAVFFVTFSAAVLYLVQDNNLKRKHLGAMFNRLPDLSLLDKLTYRSIELGFPILSVAIIAGFLLQKDISGSYWNWNTKEVYSVVSWLLYAVTLHVRLSSKLRGKKVALLSILAFGIIVFSLFVGCGG